MNRHPGDQQDDVGVQANAQLTGGNDNGANAVAPEGLVGIGKPVRVGKLDSLKATRAEIGRLYREARRRHGRYPDALTAQRLANVLGVLRGHIETDLLAERIEALESRERNRG